MKSLPRIMMNVVASSFIAGVCTIASSAQAGSESIPSPMLLSTPTQQPMQKAKIMTLHATGTFDVKLAAQAPVENADPAGPGRMTIDKQFHGDLNAKSQGQMLAAQTGVKGSAGYVAMERVTGVLQGRSGSFVLQHTGTMNRGVPTLSVTVVPDSGTEQLAGISGKMNIIIAEGKHSYEFDYTITTQP